MYIFDKSTNLTTAKTLIYPSAIAIPASVLRSLQWNDSNNLLYGILKFNKDDVNAISYVVTINPTTFEVIYTGISFNQKNSSSTFINGNKFYSSSYSDHTFEINLENKTAKPLFFNNTNSITPFTRAAVTTNNILYGTKTLAGTVNGVSLFKFDLLNNTYTDTLPNEVYEAAGGSGNGFIDSSKNQYVVLTNSNLKPGILKYNIASNSTEFINIHTYIDMIIIGKL